jgi:hypothetical protein
MIETPTVFILGAGSSVPYGFPCGADFKKQLCDFARLVDTPIPAHFAKHDTYKFVEDIRRRLADIAGQGGINYDYGKRFAQELSGAAVGSIDAFLHLHGEKEPGYVPLGKGAIAGVLMDCETKDVRTPDREIEGDWISYIIGIMGRGVTNAEEFVSRNNVSFITFNYDCVLERRLRDAMQTSYRLSEGHACGKLKDINIVHMYGALDSLPLSNEIGFVHWRNSVDKIQTVHEVEAHSPTTIETAHQCIQGAQRVYFLGFGFHELNVDILKLTELLRGKNGVVSTRYELSDEEWRRSVPSGVGFNIRGLTKDDDCLSLLKNVPLA